VRKVVPSERQRRMLVRIEQGEDVVEALAALAEEQDVCAAWIRGVGSLESATLEHTAVGEPCEILSLEGTVRWRKKEPQVRLRVALAPLSDGARIVGGVLAEAAAVDVELLVECFDDVPLKHVRAAGAVPRIEAVEAPSRSLVEPDDDGDDDDWDEPYDDADDEDVEFDAPAPEPGGAVSWAQVAAVSAAAEEDRIVEQAYAKAAPKPERPGRAPRESTPAAPKASERTMEVVPEKGDFVQHRQFGLCKIEKTDGRGGVKIKLPSGVRKTLRLDFMDVGRPRMEKGRRVFPVRPRKR